MNTLEKVKELPIETQENIYKMIDTLYHSFEVENNRKGHEAFSKNNWKKV